MSVISYVLVELGQEQKIREKKRKALKLILKRDLQSDMCRLENPETK